MELAERKKDKQKNKKGKQERAIASFLSDQSGDELRKRAIETLEKAQEVLAESGEQFLKNKEMKTQTPDETNLSDTGQ